MKLSAPYYCFLVYSRLQADKKRPSAARAKAWPRSNLRYWFSLARVVHVYLSMALLILLALFCITGIALNHNDWLKQQHSDHVVEMTLPENIHTLLEESSQTFFADPPLDALRQHLKNTYNLHPVNDIALDEDAGEIIFDYKLPAGYASAILLFDEQRMELEYRKGSWLTIMNDLHKGRHTGIVWSWVIDISAAAMLLFSVAGLFILLQNKKYRRTGLICGFIGLITPILLYWLWVPRLTGVE